MIEELEMKLTDLQQQEWDIEVEMCDVINQIDLLISEENSQLLTPYAILEL